MVIGGKFMNREGPTWLPPLLDIETFFAHCINHTKGKNEKNFFCFDCHFGPICPEGLASSHSGHATIQIRRASHRDVVRIADILKYVDLSNIQPFTINSAKIVFLQSRPQPKIVKGASHYCETCHRSIIDPVRFCSILCKLQGIRENPHDFALTLSVSGAKPGQGYPSKGISDTEASSFSCGSGIPDFMPLTPKKAAKRAGRGTQLSISKKLKLAFPTDANFGMSGVFPDEDEVEPFALSRPVLESAGGRLHHRKQARPHRSPIS